MAEYLSASVDTLKIGVCLYGVMLLFAGTPFAQGLTDPTRPPPAWEIGREQDSRQADSGPVLQSVLISPTRKVAIINGETLRQGEKFGASRVVKITESEVVLQSGHETKVLKLFPKIEKRPSSSRFNTKNP